MTQMQFVVCPSFISTTLIRIRSKRILIAFVGYFFIQSAEAQIATQVSQFVDKYRPYLETPTEGFKNESNIQQEAQRLQQRYEAFLKSQPAGVLPEDIYIKEATLVKKPFNGSKNDLLKQIEASPTVSKFNFGLQTKATTETGTPSKKIKENTIETYEDLKAGIAAELAMYRASGHELTQLRIASRYVSDELAVSRTQLELDLKNELQIGLDKVELVDVYELDMKPGAETLLVPDASAGVVRWTKSNGDEVSGGDVIGYIDAVNGTSIEIKSPMDGKFQSLKPAGEKVSAKTPIAQINFEILRRYSFKMKEERNLKQSLVYQVQTAEFAVNQEQIAERARKKKEEEARIVAEEKAKREAEELAKQQAEQPKEEPTIEPAPVTPPVSEPVVEVPPPPPPAPPVVTEQPKPVPTQPVVRKPPPSPKPTPTPYAPKEPIYDPMKNTPPPIIIYANYEPPAPPIYGTGGSGGGKPHHSKSHHHKKTKLLRRMKIKWIKFVQPSLRKQMRKRSRRATDCFDFIKRMNGDHLR